MLLLMMTMMMMTRVCGNFSLCICEILICCINQSIPPLLFTVRVIFQDTSSSFGVLKTLDVCFWVALSMVTSFFFFFFFHMPSGRIRLTVVSLLLLCPLLQLPALMSIQALWWLAIKSFFQVT
jgi:hypothetical protein